MLYHPRPIGKGSIREGFIESLEGRMTSFRGKPTAVSLVGKRVLVVGINYWPEPIGIAPYTTGMAEYLADQGAIVTVITGFPHYPEWRVPDSHRGRLAARERRNGVDVLRLWHIVPRDMTALRRAAYEATFLTHATLRGLRQRPDFVLASTPAIGGALAAASVSRRVGAPLTVVVQDLTALATQQSGIKGGGRLTAVTARLEGAALRAASAVAVVSESFVPAVQAYGVPAERISVLRNWARVTPTGLSRDEARRKLDWPADQFLAVYTGNMGLKQDLGNVVEAARLVGASSLGFVLVGDGSQRRPLETQAKGLRNLKFTGLISDDLYPVVLAAADVLILNERASVDAMSLPSKLTSYLAAGRPILAAVTDGGAAQLELHGSGGAACTAYAARRLTRDDSLSTLLEVLLRPVKLKLAAIPAIQRSGLPRLGPSDATRPSVPIEEAL
jgi:colanic acid biosynthesis glycosyl transferase WcaI